MKLKTKSKTAKKIFTLLLIGFFAAILVISGLKIIQYKIDSANLRTISKKLEKDIKKKETNSISRRYEINFDELKKKNPDTVGYLKVYGTNIDVAVVRAEDNKYYLSHDFDRNRNILGWVFADYRNKIDGTDKNIIIYGHNLNDGSLFGSLIKVIGEEWQSIPENQTIIFATEKGNSLYKVFSTYEIVPEDYYIKTDFENDKEYEKFIDTIKNRSNHNYGVEITKDDKVLTLSSCVGTGQKRVVLHAKLVEDDSELY